jgi:hypothetical protein
MRGPSGCLESLMYIKPISALALSLVACAPEEPERLSRLTRAWAAETAALSVPALTATTLLGGLAGQLCAARADEVWLNLEPDDALPISSDFESALGTPRIGRVEAENGDAMLLVLADVQLLDLPAGWVRITTSLQSERFSVDIQVLEGEASDPEAVLRLPAIGQIGLEVDTACTTARSTVRGTAIWTDSKGARQDIGIPSDAEMGSSLAFGPEVSYLPVSGAMRWTAHVDGQERSVTTEDAVEMRVQEVEGGVPLGRWPTTVRGPGWSGSAIAVLAP